MAKKGVTISFLGIDGTGKSTHAEKICYWLQENGIKCIIIPFHKWMFAGIFKKLFGNYVDKGRLNTSLKPYMDAPSKTIMVTINTVLYLTSETSNFLKEP